MKFETINNQAALGEVGARVRRERLNQNITQAALATNAGLSRRVIVDLESGNGQRGIVWMGQMTRQSSQLDLEFLSQRKRNAFQRE
jgi:transcriptional regulator with XRE-family HTH domain